MKKTLFRDVVPDLARSRGVVLEKLESFTVDRDGNMYAVTDNDGVQGTSGETQFLRLGRMATPNWLTRNHPALSFGTAAG